MTPRLREADFQAQVAELAGYYGWRTYHVFDSRRSNPGFPDLVLVRAPELIFAELKTRTGRVSAAQRDWLADLNAVATAVQEVTDAAAAGAGMHSNAAVEVYVWRSTDFDEIHARLARSRARQRKAAA